MDQNEAVERDVAIDLVRHGLYIAPAVVLVAGLLRGYSGAAAAALGIGVVVCNFLASAVLLGWAARRSPTLLAVCAFGGFFVRMAIILIVLVLARNLVDDLILAITLVGSHLGLLIWEARSVGLTLAAPGLRPARRLEREGSVTVPVLAIEVPPIDHLIKWPNFLFDDTPFAVNKVVLIYVFATIITLLFFFLAGRRAALVPRGLQNLAEASIDFIREGVIMQTIGPDGMRFLPYLLAMFFFIFFTNITEVIPLIQFPANARMAVPMILALVVWFIYNIVGVAKQGFFGYMKSSLIPPGVPWPLLFLVVPIEFVSTFLVRPFSLAVRLFANMLAGHLILVTFAVICAALWSKTLLIVILPFSFGLLVGLTGFEVLVAVLQAFIFTILAAVYIGGSMHPEH